MASELAVKGITDRPVLAGCIGPFSLAGRLFGISEIMLELLSAPETIHRLLEKCTDFLLTYIDAFKKKSVHGIIMAEPAAGMLSPQMCQEFSSTYIKTITDNVQDADFFIILHNCGNTNPLLACIQEAGATGIHLGNKCDIVAALNFLDKDRLVLGNLDPAGLFLMGSGEDVMQATTELLEKTSPYQNFIISSGCDIPPGTPQDNLKAFFTAVSEYNKAAHP
ncbi:MAG: hypothetical protein EH225_06090 [Calditrichaeota bacterium]|nr:MAG: hypothetical protein EH225_06090 [Calditrichota bacterium]